MQRKRKEPNIHPHRFSIPRGHFLHLSIRETKSNTNPGRRHQGRRSRHHYLELLETHLSVPIAINAADHLHALGHGSALAQAPHDAVQLLRGDGAVAIGIVDEERVPEVLEHRVGVQPLGIDLDKLGEVDEAVAVGVRLLEHLLQLLLRARVPQALHDGAELGAGDLTVAIGVELLEDVLQLPDLRVLPARQGAAGASVAPPRRRGLRRRVRRPRPRSLLPRQKRFNPHPLRRAHTKKSKKKRETEPPLPSKMEKNPWARRVFLVIYPPGSIENLRGSEEENRNQDSVITASAQTEARGRRGLSPNFKCLFARKLSLPPSKSKRSNSLRRLTAFEPDPRRACHICDRSVPPPGPTPTWTRVPTSTPLAQSPLGYPNLRRQSNGPLMGHSLHSLRGTGSPLTITIPPFQRRTAKLPRTFVPKSGTQ
ncbi:hypothetical protein H6P81_015806 [Aristolochia fimbriata]|uniref:Uncharacterized protein n=1 Tax=Aristolochia fimbriata TaxID=158543 RepID=A0AAV7E9L4_ARIFI|nr:hypothetical protein H6P81_015806 [Aristolochia fimbriata]